MLYVILLTFFIVIVAGYISGRKKDVPRFNDGASKPQTQSSKRYDDYFVGCKCISLSARKGYKSFEIAGVYYRSLPIEMVGRFNGYVVAETDNLHDPYAIAVYNDARDHLGFLPRGNKAQHDYIIDNGGSVHAYGYLGYNDGMYGEVCVETDKTLVTKRNKPYQVG